MINLNHTSIVRFSALPTAVAEDSLKLLERLQQVETLRNLSDAELLSQLEAEAVALKKEADRIAKAKSMGLGASTDDRSLDQLLAQDAKLVETRNRVDGLLEELGLSNTKSAQAKPALKSSGGSYFRPEKPSDQFVKLEAELQRRSVELNQKAENPTLLAEAKNRAKALLEGLIKTKTYFCDQLPVINTLQQIIQHFMGESPQKAEVQDLQPTGIEPHNEKPSEPPVDVVKPEPVLSPPVQGNPQKSESDKSSVKPPPPEEEEFIW